MLQRISPEHLVATTSGLCMALAAALRWHALRIVVVGGLTLFWLAGTPTASAATPCCGVTSIAKSGQITAQETRGTRTFQFQVADPSLLRGLRVGAPVYANFDTKQVSLDGKKPCCKILKISTAAKQPASDKTPTIPGSATTQAIPLSLKALQVNPSSVAGGNRVQGTVELVQPPGPNGVTVTLESSNPQLAGVPPRVTITHGVTSAETGPMYKATFPIDTHPVQEDTTVTIKARAGVHTLQANLRIKRPGMKSADLDPPYICDGSNKGTVKYTLTGPAPSGLKVTAHVTVRSPSGSSSTSDESETVPTGNSAGSMRIRLGRCQAHNPGERCTTYGNARVQSAGNSVSISGSCGHPPD